MTSPNPSPTSSTRPGENSLGRTESLHLLVETGLMLASERSLDVLTQCTLEAGLKLCGAELGIFVYLNAAADGESQQLCKFSGLDTATIRAVAPIIELSELVGEHTSAEDIHSRTRGLVRVNDTQQPGSSSGPATLCGALRNLRSYLGMPVRSHTGELYGALVYGHAKPGVFARDCEELIATIAAQAGVAIEAFRLGNNLTREIDIADSARALQRDTAYRLDQALEVAQLGTWTWDRSSDLLDLDDRAARLFGAERGVPFTRTALRKRIVFPEDLSVPVDRLQESLDTGKNYAAEYRVDHLDGHQTWVHSSAAPIFAANSTEVIGMIGNVQDITARKMQEQALRESEKLAATGRLAATIAHEINNPLEAITNLIYLARTDPEVPKSVQHLLDTADAELARVAQIAQQTLGFYRDTTRPVSIDIGKLLKATVDLFSRKMREKNVTCTVDVQPDLVLVGLQGEIRQVFSNLLVNAIDASSQSAIHIRARRHVASGADAVSVLIADHGAGIPESVRRRLFTPFVTTKGSVGTGLGLWVTRGIVEKQGGSIQLRSCDRSPTGTVFRVVLPVKPKGLPA